MTSIHHFYLVIFGIYLIFAFIFFLTWMMFDIVEIRIKLLNYVRSVFNGSFGYMTLPFPETKLAYRHKQIIWNISSSYSKDLHPCSVFFFSLWKNLWLLKQEYLISAHIYTPCSCWQVYGPPPRFLLGWWFWCSLPARRHLCTGNALKKTKKLLIIYWRKVCNNYLE